MTLALTAPRPAAAVRCPTTRGLRVTASSDGTAPGGRRQSGAAAAAAAADAGRTNRRAALTALVAGIAAVKAGPAAADAAAPREGEVRHSDEEWRQLLGRDSYGVLRKALTELPNSSPLVREKRAGTFVCGGCGLPLFPSTAKYESGTGWPSFYDALPGAVALESDNSIFFMPRVEVRCRRCLGHLGHVFEDGPPPTGRRYCMNGAALAFEPTQA